MTEIPSFNKFQLFVDTKSRQDERPKVSIAAERGQISFNTSFHKTYPKTQVDFVKAFYYSDKANHYIGFIFTTDKTAPGVIKVYRPKDNFGTITLLAFFKKFHLNDKKYSQRYEVVEQTENGVTFYVVKIPIG